jgi:tetratricopeptide (TPR) repeat protein
VVGVDSRRVLRGVFINYRGEDTHSYGALLYTELVRQFGEDRVFLDCHSIPAGADFVEELLGQVRSARVLLAVIGPRWLTATDPSDRRRIDDPADWIRRELVEAFAIGVRVIPVLTEHASLPDAADLPADIAALGRCQYRQLRRREPVSDLARIIMDLTELDPTLAVTARRRDDVPRQLPTAPRLFTGRTAELATLTDAVTASPDAAASTTILAITGSGGTGKTTLALYWAYQHLHRFPDGQLYVNLRGFDPCGQPMPASQAVRGFLNALGVDLSTLPADLDAQTARYRSVMAGKRMLIVLDNARDIEQIAALLPTGPSCAVLITSRRQFAGLAALHAADLLGVGVLPDHDAHELLARHLGQDRLSAEPDATGELLAVCAGLPLAIRIVASRAGQHPNFPLSVLAEELRDISSRLDGLDAGDPHASLRTVLSWSLNALSSPATSLFRLLGSAPGPDIGVPAAASLAGLPPGQTRTILRELDTASLVHQYVPGRYRMHDLIRLYATDTRHEVFNDDVRPAAPGRINDGSQQTRDQTRQSQDATAQTSAIRRVVEFYLHSAHAGDSVLDRQAHRLRLDPPGAGVRPLAMADRTAVMAWFTQEYSCLLAALNTAADHGWDRMVWQMAWVLHTFQQRQGHLQNNLASWRAGQCAAERLGDQTVQVLASRMVGATCARAGGHNEALGHLGHALTLAESTNDLHGQAHIHRSLAWTWERLGDYRQAFEHATSALRLIRAVGDSAREADMLNDVGWYACRLGDHEVAWLHCAAALVVHWSYGDNDGMAATLESLGYVADHRRHHTRAVGYYQRALVLRREQHNVYQEAITLDRLGRTHVALGQHEHARAVWQWAERLYRTQQRDDDAGRIRRRLDALDQQVPSTPRDDREYILLPDAGNNRL